MSSSLWGCELKKKCLKISHTLWHVILLVRMWVEKHPEWTGGTSWSSSSLWGCELKTCCGSVGNAMSGHPPCEDVSWKLAHTMNLICPLCHPPCEDVSWKDDELNLKALLDVILHVRMWVEKSYTTCSAAFTIVILLVRMWVEKTISSIYRQKVSSSSMWGCELKNSIM